MSNVVGHDHGTVNQNSKIDGTNRQQTDRNICQIHQHQGEQQRKGNRQHDEHGQSWAASENQQDQQH
jgi:hypothetical protein